MANSSARIDLIFNADASKAKAAMNELANSLQAALNFGSKSTGIASLDRELNAATINAAKLEAQLKEAVNVNTGKLDLTKFNDSLRFSGMSLEKYKNNLITLGPAGEQAFVSLARSISTAEIPLRRTSALVDKLAISLKNTMVWQFSSSLMHGFMGSIQTAYNYAQDLNSSLNNIRIVTGQSVDQMAKFAEEANRSAKALSSSTGRYADAALIFYQQGLDDKAVKERTNTVIKMANVTRESSKDVSSYMTAIWNNFDNSSKKLEYYADVLAKLGAVTAASSEEIAGGLEKFVAIGNTIGLSYEYAASMITTLVDKTRQSEDVVGTALKTILARIQGLKLGDTLDDGTDLNKYSQALASVGVHIKDTAGNLKDMDIILDDLGSKWNTLGKDTQVALAQVVGGTRQYTQLISLMDNWDAFQQNVSVAKGSEGALQEQADIYAESWEAAQKRVQASAEAIYSALINDDFFISLNNVLAGLLNGINNFIKGLGGVKGVLVGLSSVALLVFDKQISNSLDNLVHNLSMMTKSGQQQIITLQKEAQTLLETLYADREAPAIADAYKDEAKAQLMLLNTTKNLSDQEKVIANTLMSQVKARTDQRISIGQQLEISEKQFDITLTKISKIRENIENIRSKKPGAGPSNLMSKDLKDMLDSLHYIATDIGNTNLFTDQFSNVLNGEGTIEEKVSRLKELMIGVKDIFPQLSSDAQNAFTTLDAAIKAPTPTIESLQNALKEFLGTIYEQADNVGKALELVNKKIAEMEANPKSDATVLTQYRQLAEALRQLEKQNETYIDVLERKNIAENNSKAATDALKEFLKEAGITAMSTSDKITAMAGALTSLNRILQMIKGWGDIFSDENMSVDDKFSAITSSFLSMIPTLLMAGRQLVRLGDNAIAVQGALKGLSKEAINTEIASASLGKKLYKGFGKIGWIITGITLLVEVLKLLNKYLNDKKPLSAQEKLKSLNEQLDKLREATKTTKEEIQSINDAFDDYSDVRTSLDNCTEGTTLWYEALAEVQKSADNMLNTFPILGKILSDPMKYFGENFDISQLYDEHGLLNIELLTQKVLELENQKLQVQHMAEAMAEGQQQEIQNAFTIEDTDFFSPYRIPTRSRKSGWLSVSEPKYYGLNDIAGIGYEKDYVKALTELLGAKGYRDISSEEVQGFDGSLITYYYTSDALDIIIRNIIDKAIEQGLNDKTLNLSTALSNYLQNNPLLGDILYRSISTSGLGVSIPSMENFDWTTQSIPNGFGENVNLYDYLLESGILSQNAISQYNLKLQDENYNYTSAAMPILAETLYSNTYTDEQKKIIDFNVAKQLGSQVKQFQTVADYQITDAMEYLNTGGDFFAGIPNIQDYKDKNNQFDISKDKAGNFIIKSQIKGVEDFILTQAQIAAKKVLVDEESIDVEELISRELKRFSNLQEIEQNYILGQSLNKKQLDSLTEDNIANINSFTGYNLTLENVLATWQKGWIEDLTIAQNKMIDALGPGLTEQVRENWGSVFTDENMDLSSMDVDFFKQYEYRTGGASQYLDFIDQIPKLIEAYDVIQKGEELSQEAYDTLVKFTTLTQKDFDITANGFKYIGEASNTFLTDSIINLQKVEKLVNDLTETEKTLTRDKENHNITGNLTLLKYLGYDFEDIFQLSDENFASLQQQYSSLVNGQMALVMSDAGKDAWMSTIKSWEQFGDTGLQWADISTSSQQMVLSNIAEQEGYDFKDLSAYGDVSNKTTYDRAKSAMLAEEAVIDFWANQEELFADNAKGLKALLEQKEENLDKESREQLLKAKTILANLFGVEVEAINMEWIKSIDWASLMSDEAINVQTALTNKVPDNANAVRTAVQMTSRNSLDLFERPRQTADKFSAELGFQGVRFAEIERLQDAIKGSGKEITEFLMEAYADEINAAGGDADLFAESKGFINFEEYATAFSNALELGGHFIAAGLDSSVRTIYNELYKKIGATISDEEELFANFLSTAYQEGGEAGLYNAKAIIEKWGVNASTELKKLAQLDIDWKNMSIEEIIEMAQAANIDVSGLESTIQALADSARAAIAPLQTITDIFGKFDTTNSLIDKSYAGEALTSEEIEAYKKLNPNWTPEDFIYNADGTATLTASAMAPETIAQAYVDSLNDTAEEMGTKAEGLQKWDADEEWTEEDKSAIDSIAQMLLAQGLISEGSEEATTLAQFGTATTAEGINAAGMDVQKALNDLGFSDMMALSTEAERFYADQAEAGKEAAADAQNTFSKPLMQADDFGLVRDEIDELGDSIQKMAKQSDELADSLESDAIAADEVAKEIKRYNKAIDSISNSYDDWMDALDSENIEKQSKALNEMDQAMSDMLDIDYGSLDEQFLIDNASLMKDAANGVEGAYEELQAKAEDQLILQAGVDINDEEAWAKINSLQDTIHNSIDDIQIGATIDNAGAIAAMNELINMAGMTATEATNYLSNMGVDANVKEVTVPQSSLVTGYKATVTNQPAFNAAGESINVSSVTYDAVPTMVDGEVTVPALEVTSATKSSGGNFKYANSSRPSRRGGGGGGRGGGGSRRPTAEKKENKSKERYHTITNQLEDLTDAYEKVSTAADRAFGKSKIKLIQDQEKALQSLIGKERDHLDEVNKYYESDKANLDKVSQYVGFDVQLDENGSIINFDDIQDKMFAEYNKHINKKGEVTDMDEEAWKEYEKEWQDIMDLISQYEETQDLKKEVEKQIQDYVNELYDLQLSEITYKVDVQIEVSEDALGILDYMLNKINDDAWQAAEVIAVMGQRTGELLDQNDTYTKGITDILMKHTKNITDDEGNIIKKAKLTEEDINGFLSGDPEAFKKLVGMNDEFTAEEVESLRGYYNALIENNNALMEEQRAIFQTALDAFNAYTEELDRSIEKIDHLANLTEHYGNIVDIVGKKNLGISNALMESIGQASVDEAINRVEATRTKMLQLEEEVAKAQAARDEAAAKGWEEDVKLWDKNLKEMNDALDAAEEDFMQSWEDALTSISEKFDAAVERAITTLSDSLAGPLLGSLEELQEMFDRQDMVAERFLPDYEKIYELNKLNRDIQNSMDDTDNIKGKQELAKLQEEINKLEEDGVEVSQYQIENLRRRYELKLAELALNEAQNAKSEVRMSRNADGDWSYVYTASEEDVAEAEQNYEDKLFAIQEANAEYINNLQDMMVQMQEEMSSKIEEIMTDETLSMEERMAKVNETTAFYQEQMGYYKDQLSLVLSENQLIYEDDWAKYSEATGYKISADELYLDHFDELKLSMLTGYEDLEALQQAFNDAIGSPDSGGLLYELDNAYQTWKLNTEEAFEAAGTSMDGYKDLMEEDVAAIIDASEEATEAIEDMSNNIDVAFNKMLDSLSNWQSQYSQVIQDMLDKNTLLAESFNKLLKEWTNFEDSQLEDEEPTDDEPEKEPEDDNGGDDPANEEKGGTVHYDAGTRYWMYTDKGKKSGTVHGERTVNWTIKKGNKLYVPELGKWVSDETVGSDYDKKHRKVTYFDTGGYTGEWGNEGRWAMLHEKEIILNKNDTSNLLSAIGIIRDISKAIDLNAYASAGFGTSIRSPWLDGNKQELQQHVEITAEFPNATDKNEILEAFNNVIDLASQYANRK